ncbi:MAG: hypothetical protein SNJ73_08825, partial [Acetobacteraceae bacterium]
MFHGAFGTSGQGCGLPLGPRSRVLLLLALVGLVLLGGCGKRGDPTPPGPDEAIVWPRTFPAEPPLPSAPPPPSAPVAATSA